MKTYLWFSRHQNTHSSKNKISGCSRYICNVYRGPVTDMNLPWSEDDRWCTSRVEVKNDCSYTSTPPLALMMWTGTPLPLLYTYFELLFIFTHVINTGCGNGYMYFYCIYLCHCILFWGDFPASGIYVPTSREIFTYEDGMNRVFRNIGT